MAVKIKDVTDSGWVAFEVDKKNLKETMEFIYGLGLYKEVDKYGTNIKNQNHKFKGTKR